MNTLKNKTKTVLGNKHLNESHSTEKVVHDVVPPKVVASVDENAKMRAAPDGNKEDVAVPKAKGDKAPPITAIPLNGGLRLAKTPSASTH